MPVTVDACNDAADELVDSVASKQRRPVTGHGMRTPTEYETIHLDGATVACESSRRVRDHDGIDGGLCQTVHVVGAHADPSPIQVRRCAGLP